MHHQNRTGRLACRTAFVLAAALAATAWAAEPDHAPDPAVEPAISRPSEEVKLTFAAGGLVAAVRVTEGQQVHAGDVLLQQDDAQEQIALGSAKLDAESMAEIEFEKVDVAYKTKVYERKRKAFDEGQIVSLPEVEEAKSAVELAKAQVAVAQLHHEQKVMDYEREKVKVARMRLVSPIDGMVQRVLVHAGEMSDPQSRDGAIVVVRNDPVWVEMNIAADRAEKLHVGQELPVRYKAPAGQPANRWQTGTISYFPPHADAASGTETVRLTLPNPAGVRSGLAMEVKLPADVAAVAAGGQPSGGTPALPPLPN